MGLTWNWKNSAVLGFHFHFLAQTAELKRVWKVKLTMWNSLANVEKHNTKDEASSFFYFNFFTIKNKVSFQVQVNLTPVCDQLRNDDP